MTDDERAMLDLERRTFRYAGSKERLIREQFDMTPTRYYQLLLALIDRPEALAYSPVVVNRLRRRARRSA